MAAGTSHTTISIKLNEQGFHDIFNKYYVTLCLFANQYTENQETSADIVQAMLPFITEEDHENLSFKNGDYIFVPEIRKAIEDKSAEIKAYVVGDTLKEITLKLGDMTDAEREIILKGCLINYYRG